MLKEVTSRVMPGHWFIDRGVDLGRSARILPWGEGGGGWGTGRSLGNTSLLSVRIPSERHDLCSGAYSIRVSAGGGANRLHAEASASQGGSPVATPRLDLTAVAVSTPR